MTVCRTRGSATSSYSKLATGKMKAIINWQQLQQHQQAVVPMVSALTQCSMWQQQAAAK